MADGGLALADGIVEEVLGVVDAAEELMGLGVLRIGLQGVVEQGGGLVGASCLDGRSGSRGVGAEGGSRHLDQQKREKAERGGTPPPRGTKVTRHAHSTGLIAKSLVRSVLFNALSATTSLTERPEVISARVRLTTPT